MRSRLHTGLTRSAEDSTAETFARLFVVMVRIGDDSGDDDHDDADDYSIRIFAMINPIIKCPNTSPVLC